MGVGTLRFHRGRVAAKTAQVSAAPVPVIESAPVVEPAAPAAPAAQAATVEAPRITAPSGPVKTAAPTPKTNVEHRRR